MQDQEIIQLIQNTNFLNPNDKGFLLESLKVLSPLEKIKLKSSLVSNNPPSILQNLQIIKAKIYQNSNQPNLRSQNTQEESKKEGLLEKITSKLFPKKKPQIVAPSILNDPRYLGSNIPRPINENTVPLQRLDTFIHPAQLKFLHAGHVSFGLSTNNKQILKVFFDKTEEIFDGIENVDIKRGYFMNYIQSSLFNNYLNTALTGLKHEELKPRKVVLNMLHQINPNNLNINQFEIAAEITSHLRMLVGI